MSERGLSSALQAAADSDHVRLLMFVKLGLDSGTLYLHNGVGSLTWGSNAWLGVGDFGGISSIEESDQISPFEVTLTLSGLDQDMMDEVMLENYFLRPVSIYMGALNTATGALLADPDEIWSGFMDSASVTLGEENAIMLTCESEFALFDKSNDSAFSDADLQSKFAGDLFFEFLPSMADAVVVWRGERVTTGTGNMPGGGRGQNGQRNTEYK